MLIKANSEVFKSFSRSYKHSVLWKSFLKHGHKYRIKSPLITTKESRSLSSYQQINWILHNKTSFIWLVYLVYSSEYVNLNLHGWKVLKVRWRKYIRRAAIFFFCGKICIMFCLHLHITNSIWSPHTIKIQSLILIIPLPQLPVTLALLVLLRWSTEWVVWYNLYVSYSVLKSLHTNLKR